MKQDREDAIRARAHQLWEAEGQPLGQDGQHWRRATQEIDAVLSRASKTSKSTVVPTVTAAADDAAGSGRSINVQGLSVEQIEPQD